MKGEEKTEPFVGLNLDMCICMVIIHGKFNIFKLHVVVLERNYARVYFYLQVCKQTYKYALFRRAK